MSVESRQYKTLKKLRKAVSQIVLTAQQVSSENAELAWHYQELCDEYSLRILISWLCKKLTLEPIAHLWTDYPFLHPLSEVISNELEAAVYPLLESLDQPSISIIGSLYEQCKDSDYDNRKSSGQFFTPQPLVRFCIELAWPKPLAKALKIIDPACGTGNFLCGVIEHLINCGAQKKQILSFANTQLFGLDIDARSASLARIALTLSLAKAIPKITEDEIGEALANFRKHIQISDALMEALIDPNEKFDLVITNPPYISFGARNQSKIHSSQSQLLKAAYPLSSQYKIRLHSVFQEIALRLAKPGGQAVLLIPDSFLVGSYYQGLRQKILSESRIKSMHEFHEGAFTGAVVGRWCVAQYERFHPDDDRLEDYTVQLSVNRPNGQTSYRIKRSQLIDRDKSRIRLVTNDFDRDIMVKLDRLDRLSSVMRGHTGMRAKNGQLTIKQDKPTGPTWKKGIASGRAVKPFQVTWDGTYLNTDPELLYTGGFDPLIIEYPKILMRQTADRIVAALDESQLYHLNNVHSFSLTNKHWDLRFLELLFNSSFWLYLYRLKTREEGRALAQIDIETVESMPIASLPSGFANSSQSFEEELYSWYGLSAQEANHVKSTSGQSQKTAI